MSEQTTINPSRAVGVQSPGGCALTLTQAQG